MKEECWMERTVIFSLQPGTADSTACSSTRLWESAELHFSWISLRFYDHELHPGSQNICESSPLPLAVPLTPLSPPSVLVSFHAWPFGEAVNSPAFRCGLAANAFFFSSTGLESPRRAARASVIAALTCTCTRPALTHFVQYLR